MALRRLSCASILLVTASLTAVGCGDDPPADMPPWWGDGSVSPVEKADAGGAATDAATAPRPDAGTVTPGASDGGTTTPMDGQVAPMDAGSSDAGNPASDAGAQTGDAGADAQLDAASQGDGSAGDGSAGDGSAGDGSAGDGSVSGDAGPQASCLDGITNYGAAGPFQYETKTSGKLKFWVPTVPAGCKVPVVHLANGTTANCLIYRGALERLASHGFLTVCYEDPDTGAGAFGMQAFEAALSMYPNLADKKLGSTGHSQGGQAALVTTQLAEAKWGNEMIYAALAMQPASGYGEKPVGQTWQQSYAKIKAPVFMFSGDSGRGLSSSRREGQSVGDGLVGVSWVAEGFDALNDSIEAYHWTAVGATHIPTPVGEQQQVSIPWFRWKLLGDKAACAYFKKMPMSGKWQVQKEQNAKSCD